MLYKLCVKATGLLAAAFLLSGAMSAASISGEFNLSSTIYVTTTDAYFGLRQNPLTPANYDSKAVVINPATGSFSDLVAADVATINHLSIGTPSIPNWIMLPDGINVDLSYIADPGKPVCSASISSDCVAYAGSPIVLQQTSTGVTAIFSLVGQAHTAGETDYSPLIAKLSSDLAGYTTASLIAQFNSTGFISNQYSANFIATAPPTVPEPASMALLGAGLFGLGVLGKRKLVK